MLRGPRRPTQEGTEHAADWGVRSCLPQWSSPVSLPSRILTRSPTEIKQWNFPLQTLWVLGIRYLITHTRAHTGMHTHAHARTLFQPYPAGYYSISSLPLSPLQLPGTAEKKSTLTEQVENWIFWKEEETQRGFPIVEPGIEPRYFWLQNTFSHQAQFPSCSWDGGVFYKVFL